MKKSKYISIYKTNFNYQHRTKDKVKTKTKYKIIFYEKILSLFVLITLPMSAFSATDQLTEILNKAVEYAQSGPARGFCLLAIVGAGYLWLARGIIPKSWAIGIMGGAGFIFGASYIAETVLGVSS